MNFKFLLNFNNYNYNFLFIIFFKNFFFITNYYKINELLWQEGLMFDFLQKKIIDNWLKKFVLFSGNLFNERLLFDTLIKFYLNLIIWPMHKLFILDFNNIGNILLINLYIFIIIILLFSFYYFIFLIF